METPTTLTASDTARPPRRHDVDWLRVLAILALHVFHTGMFFNNWGWHIKNPERLPELELPMAFLHQWRMPLLFFVSGIGTILALRSRSLLAFVGERHRRLLVPLVFGMLVIVPPQIYCERLTQGQTYSYGAFYRTVFEGTSYPQGNTSWHHLWFIAYLLVYAMLAVPLLAAWRTSRGAVLLDRLRARLSRGLALWWLAAPIAVVQLALRWRWPETHNLVSDWATFAFQGLLFLYGLVIGMDERVWDTIRDRRRLSLTLGVLVLASLLVDDVLGIQGGYPYVWEVSLLSCLTWFWVLAAAGYARRYLSFRNRFLDYASEGIYPFYILHQTVIIVLAYPMIGWVLPAWPKFFLLLVSSFVASWALYAVAIKPWAWVRPFFGLRPQGTGARVALASRETAEIRATAEAL
jgi:glucan biosynthesis protein C